MSVTLHPGCSFSIWVYLLRLKLPSLIDILFHFQSLQILVRL